MPAIFVSYRRQDSVGHAGRLFDRLQEHCGLGHVFWDVSGSIEPGEPFDRAIERAIGSCEALLAVIGQQWLMGTDATGKRRLEAPNDYVRLELAMALQRNIRVIPVLVQRAAMPRAEDLPQDLQPLARHQAIELSDNRWDFDVAQLIDTLEKLLGQRKPPGVARWTKAAVASVLLIAVGFGVWEMWLNSGGSTSDPVRDVQREPFVTAPDPLVSSPPKMLPGYLYGKWKGETPGLLVPHTIEVSISPDEYLLKSSIGLGYCIGRLEILSQDGNSVKFTERIIEGNCIAASEVTLSKADDLTLNFLSLEVMGGNSGKLHKVR
jgi:hypothetical protein